MAQIKTNRSFLCMSFSGLSRYFSQLVTSITSTLSSFFPHPTPPPLLPPSSGGMETFLIVWCFLIGHHWSTSIFNQVETSCCDVLSPESYFRCMIRFHSKKVYCFLQTEVPFVFPRISHSMGFLLSASTILYFSSSQVDGFVPKP